MSEVTFFTAEAYDTWDKDDNEMTSYDMTIKTSLKDVSTFLASNFDKKAVVSFSELFTPYTTIDDSDNVMPIARFPNREQQNYVNGFGFVTSTLEDANPGSGDARQEVIAIDFASGINYGICPTYKDQVDTQIYDKDDINDINSVGFRAPMMMAGFGFTTEGLPTPSAFEQMCHDSGDAYYPPSTATSGYDSYQMAPRIRERTDIWNSGPVDIRWDKYKGMFVAAPEMFIGYALCDIPVSSGRWSSVLGGFEVDSAGDFILDSSGNKILLPGYRGYNSGEIECAIGRYDDFNVPSGTADNGVTSFSTHKLLIINRSISMDIASGSLVIATRLNNGEYFPIFVDCAPDTM